MRTWTCTTSRPGSARTSSRCLTAADDTDEARSESCRYIDELLDDTGWRPRATTAFAGALQYREYDFMTRLLMRLMMARGHHPTDTSRHYDYTDWNDVEAFARECVTLASATAAVDCRASGP